MAALRRPCVGTWRFSGVACACACAVVAAALAPAGRAADPAGGKGKPSVKTPGRSPKAANANKQLNPYDPTAHIDYAMYDPSIDPGIDPVFASDPALNTSESYRYVVSKPGDHRLPPDTFAFQYDVRGRHTLQQVVAQAAGALANSRGIAIYLAKGTALNAADLKTVQAITRPVQDGGLGFTSIETLFIYNLKTLDGGTETATPAMPGTPIAVNMWDNGWQRTGFKNVVLDDLEEVKDGTFCDNRFDFVSLKAARTIGVMAFGGHRGGGPPQTALYLPSAETIKAHAFRRNKRLLKVNLPRVTIIEPYAFDDCDRLQYVNAPELRRLGRNAFNDTGKLVSVNMPRLEYMHVAVFGINDSLRILRLPSLTLLDGDGLSMMRELVHLYLPSVKALKAGAVNSCGKLQAVYVPQVEVVERHAFAGCGSLKRIDLPMVRVLHPEAFAGVNDIQVNAGGRPVPPR